MLTINEGRSSVADAVPFLYDNAIVMFKKGTAMNYFFTESFNSVVYLVVGGCLVLVLLLLLLMERCEEGGDRRMRMALTLKDALNWIIGNIEVLLCGLFNRPSNSESTSRAGRVLVVSWMVLGVILTSMYSSQLTSSLAVRHEALPFTSLEEMLNQREYTWGYLGASATLSLLKVSHSFED
ncbi:probable glutamate receptor [Littorina saxatilis]|uniref:probable glutamate receptor n=1 Tax=Littorina saxatilis TaxID=31220 RepID=UPI0038B59834